MKNFLSITLLLVATHWSVAQSFDVKLFNGKTRQTRERLQQNIKEYKRVKKENLRYLRERKKRYKAMKDSLNAFQANSPELSNDSLKYMRQLQRRYFIYTDSLYTLDDIGSWDSLQAATKKEALTITQEQLEGNEYFGRYRQLQSQIGSYRKEIRNYRDSLRAIDSLGREDIKYLMAQKRKELSAEYETGLESVTKEIVNQQAPDLPGGFQNEQLDQFKSANAHLKNRPDKSLLSKAQSVDYFKGKEEVLKAAMDDVAELKEKYSKVIDSNDLSTATKVNSLKDEPLANRLVFGGTFQLHVDQNTSLDINPEISYRVNKQLDIGLGGTYRLNVETKDLANTIQEKQVVGSRGFVEHLLFRSFYFHGEVEALKGSFQDTTEEFRQWNYSLLAGIERRFTLRGNVEGQVSVLYNFLYADHPLYRSPWSFRFGFNVKGKK